MSARFKLGDRVTITGQVVKERRMGKVSYADSKPPFRPAMRQVRDSAGNKLSQWESCNKPLTEGVIVGKRTIQQGTVSYGGWDEGVSYRPTPGTAESVWLVAVAMDLNPVYCRDAQVNGVTA